MAAVPLCLFLNKLHLFDKCWLTNLVELVNISQDYSFFIILCLTDSWFESWILWCILVMQTYQKKFCFYEKQDGSRADSLKPVCIRYASGSGQHPK
jgi:hypothetical protein